MTYNVSGRVQANTLILKVTCRHVHCKSGNISKTFARQRRCHSRPL